MDSMPTPSWTVSATRWIQVLTGCWVRTPATQVKVRTFCAETQRHHRDPGATGRRVPSGLQVTLRLDSMVRPAKMANEARRVALAQVERRAMRVTTR
jgi:hypothetical protein